MKEINYLGPCAFLFCNGNAAFFNEEDDPLCPIQAKGWRGLHEFHEKYPNAPVSIQGADPISKETIKHFLKHIKLPEE